jgi:hypothetical protein
MAGPVGVGVSLIVIPARLSVPCCPVAAVTLPFNDAGVACPEPHDCLAKPGIAEISRVINNTPRSGFIAPALAFPHIFKSKLRYRTRTP